MNEGKLEWNTWDNYPKVTYEGNTYAEIGGRYYTQHAVDRMQPSGYGTSSGKVGTEGRSISPTFVEQVIRTGTPSTKVVDGVNRTVFISGSVTVVTEEGGKIIVTVITK